MNKTVSLTLAICILFMNIAAFAQGNDLEKAYFLIAEQAVYVQDFEGEVEEAFTPSGAFSIVTEDDGNKALHINGTSAYISTGLFGPSMKNYIVEADMRQIGCNGSTNANTAIRMRSQPQKGAIAFIHSDITRFSSLARTLTNTDGSRDRLLIGRTAGTDNISNWVYAKMSDKETGALDRDARSFSSYKRVTAIVADDTLLMTMSDKGTKLAEVKTDGETINTDADGRVMSEFTEGRTVLSTHSTSVYYDNISIRNAELVSDYNMLTENKVLLVGMKLGFEIFGDTKSGDSKKISPESFVYEYDEARLSVDAENGTIKALSPGRHNVKVKCTDYFTGKEQTREFVFDAVENYDFDSITIELDNESVTLGTVLDYKINGYMDNDVYFVRQSDYEISFDGGELTDSTVAFEKAGENIITVSYDDIVFEKKVYVSKYSSIYIDVPGKIVKGDSAELITKAVLGENTEKINAVYSIEGSAAVLEDNVIKGVSLGNVTVKTVVDNLEIVKEITISEQAEGVLFTDDFEGDGLSDYVGISRDNVVSHDGNNVLRLRNEITPVFGGSWLNHKVEGRVKIVKSRLERGLPNTSFEVLVRRLVPDADVTGGRRGTQFSYAFGKTSDENYMRINIPSGPNVNIEDNEWHTFSVESYNNQHIFTIGDTVMQYYTESNVNAGGIQLRAANCEVYVDDIKVTKVDVPKPKSDSVPSALTPYPQRTNAVNVYDSGNIYELTSVKCEYEDGTYDYITRSADVEYTLKSGNATLIKSGKLRFKKDAQTGDVTVVTISYKGLECDIEIPCVRTIDELEYISSTIWQRREDFASNNYMRAEFGNRLSTGSLSFMPYVTNMILMYPREQNYDREIRWLCDITIHENTVGMNGDFTVNNLLILRKYKDYINCSQEVWDYVDWVLLEEYYSSPTGSMSENHKLVYYTNALIAGEMFPNDYFYAHKKTGAELVEEFRAYLKDWINYRYLGGFGEYDSTYMAIDIVGFQTLYTLSDDSENKKLSSDMLDYIYMDLLNDSIGDRLGGAHGRTYFNNHVFAKASVLDIQFDIADEDLDERKLSGGTQMAVFMIGSHIPDKVVTSFAREGDKRFTNLERKRLYAIPDDWKVTESLRKYSHVTPNYILGSVLYYEDPYKNAVLKGDKYYRDTGTFPEGTWMLQGHQEIMMSAIIKGDDRLVILESHPGPDGYRDHSSKHSYFSGDYNCMDGSFAQNEGLMLGIHKITNPSDLHFTHFWIPKNYIDTIEEIQGWLFINQNDTYMAIRPLKDGNVTNEKAYRWGSEDEYFTIFRYRLSDYEIITESSNTAFVLQMADTTEYPHGFESFKQEMLEKEIKYNLNNGGMLEFTGLNGNTLKLNYKDSIYVNDEKLDFDAWPMHKTTSHDGEVYMQADWNKGLITMSHNGYKKIITLAGKSFNSVDAYLLYQQMKNVSALINQGGYSFSRFAASDIIQEVNKSVFDIATGEVTHVKHAILTEMVNAVRSIRGVFTRSNEMLELCADTIEKINLALELRQEYEDERILLKNLKSEFEALIGG